MYIAWGNFFNFKHLAMQSYYAYVQNNLLAVYPGAVIDIKNYKKYKHCSLKCIIMISAIYTVWVLILISRDSNFCGYWGAFHPRKCKHNNANAQLR